MTTNDFTSAPTITRERLEHEDLTSVFARRPQWAALGELAQGDLPAEDDYFVVRVGEKWPAIFHLNAISAAILIEATRFPGFGVTTNLNGKPDDPAAMPYLKLTYRGDNITVSRIVMDAGPHQRVKPRDDRRDLHPDELTKVGGRTPASRTARTVLLRHAKEAAVRYGWTEAETEGYVNNVQALLDYHDENLGIAEELY